VPGLVCAVEEAQEGLASKYPQRFCHEELVGVDQRIATGYSEVYLTSVAKNLVSCTPQRTAEGSEYTPVLVFFVR
jgi:hypothetical protein